MASLPVLSLCMVAVCRLIETVQFRCVCNEIKQLFIIYEQNSRANTLFSGKAVRCARDRTDRRVCRCQNNDQARCVVVGADAFVYHLLSSNAFLHLKIFRFVKVGSMNGTNNGVFSGNSKHLGMSHSEER